MSVIERAQLQEGERNIERSHTRVFLVGGGIARNVSLAWVNQTGVERNLDDDLSADFEPLGGTDYT
jgi:hypothetical protein